MSLAQARKAAGHGIVGGSEVTPGCRQDTVLPKRFGLTTLAEFTAIGFGIDSFFGAHPSFDVFAVIKTEADLHRRRRFSGARRIPQRIAGSPLQMPMFMAIGRRIHQFRRARFVFEAAIREEHALQSPHRF